MGKEILKTRIIAECKRQGIVLDTQIAYVLATAKWETNHTFKPVKEAYWLSEKWRKKNLRYYPYYGRGLVQITWKKNYEKFGKLLGIDLVHKPHYALKPDVAIFILVYGMIHGTFTGKKLNDYIKWYNTDFVGARRIVNGRDKATSIAKIATKILGDM